MKTRIFKKDSEITIAVEGILDTDSAYEFHNVVKPLNVASFKKIDIDFQNLTHITSAGLREILIIRKQISDSSQLHIINANKNVIEIFEMVGFDDLINIAGPETHAEHDAIDYENDAKKQMEQFLTYSFKELLQYRAKHNTEDVIFIDKCGKYTWGEFSACVQIAAMDLYKMGVRKGSHVAICSPNSVNWMISFFAIQQLGGLAFLLNFAYTESELVDLCQLGEITHLCYGDNRASLDSVLFADNLISNDKLSIKDTYFIGQSRNFKERLGEYEAVNDFFDEKVLADYPAVVIFSSGSTGKPKGVILSAHNLLKGASNHAKDLHDKDKICLISPMCHSLGLQSGAAIPLLANCSIYIPENIRTTTVLHAIEREKCTCIYAVPTMMLAIAHNSDFSSERVSGLRTCSFGGAPLAESQLKMLREKFPNTRFRNTYGLSEHAPVTMTSFDDSSEVIAKSVGRPIPGVEVKIMDAVEPNSEGEILVRSVDLMVGYYKMCIEDQPFDDDGWLHTGDLGRIDENGVLWVVGRIKDIIIRGGENIIPSEIAAAISGHEMISDVKVSGVPDDFYGELVAAAIVLNDGAIFDESAMNEYLSSRIAKYKIPVYYLVYDAFPTMSNGKIDSMRIKREMIEKYKIMRTDK